MSKKLHEIVTAENYLESIVEDPEGKQWRLIGTDWSGFSAVPYPDKDRERMRTLGYYREGFKLVKAGK